MAWYVLHAKGVAANALNPFSFLNDGLLAYLLPAKVTRPPTSPHLFQVQPEESLKFIRVQYRGTLGLEGTRLQKRGPCFKVGSLSEIFLDLR